MSAFLIIGRTTGGWRIFCARSAGAMKPKANLAALQQGFQGTFNADLLMPQLPSDLTRGTAIQRLMVNGVASAVRPRNDMRGGQRRGMANGLEGVGRLGLAMARIRTTGLAASRPRSVSLLGSL